MLMADLHHFGRGRAAPLPEALEQFDLVEAAGQMAATYSAACVAGSTWP